MSIILLSRLHEASYFGLAIWSSVFQLVPTLFISIYVSHCAYKEHCLGIVMEMLNFYMNQIHFTF